MRRDEAGRSKPYGARKQVCMLREVSIAFAVGCAGDGPTAQKIAANRERFLDPTLAENDIGADPDPLPGKPGRVEPQPFELWIPMSFKD